MQATSFFPLALISMTMLLGACQPKYDDIDQVRTLMEDGRFADAKLYLKSYIAAQPQDMEARLRLAQVLLAEGDAEGAQKELARVVKDETLASQANELLLRANLFTYDFDAIALLLSTAPLNSEAKALYTAINNFFLNVTTDDIVTEQDTPIHELISAYQLASSGQCLAAIERLEDATNDQYTFEASLLSAHCYRRAQFFEKSNESFSSLKQEYPNSGVLALEYMRSLYLAGALDDSLALANTLKLSFPNNVLINETLGFIYFDKGEYEAALPILQQTLNGGYETEGLRLRAAIAAFETKRFEVAYQLLAPLRKNAAIKPALARLIAAVDLSLGYANSAAQQMLTLPQLETSDLPLFLGTVNRLPADSQQALAQRLLDKGNTFFSKNEATKGTYGTFMLSQGNDEGARLIEDALQINSNAFLSRLALIQYHLDNNDVVAAKEQINELINREETRALGQTLQASLLVDSETAEAQALLETVIAENPEFIPAQLLLFQLHANKKQVPQATKLMQQMTAAPSAYTTSIAQVLIKESRVLGQNTADNLFRDWMKAAPEEAMINFYAGLYSYMTGQHQHAFDVLSAVKDKVSNESFWMLLTEVATALGDNDRINNIVAEWVPKMPTSEYARLYQLHQLTKTPFSSDHPTQTDAAIKAFPDAQAVILLASNLYAKMERYSDAASLYAKLKDEFKNTPMGIQTGGILAFNKKQYANAIPLLSQTYESAQDSMTSIMLFLSMNNTNARDKATAFALTHAQAHPDDTKALLIFANEFMRIQHPKTQDMYELVLTQAPKNHFALNNLAWLKTQNGQVAEAKELIEKAMDLYPKSADIINTGAYVYEKAGDLAKAESLYQYAVQLAPSNKQLTKDLEGFFQRHPKG